MHINSQCTPLWCQHKHVFTHANSHKDADCHLAIDYHKHLAPIVSIRQWLWQALEKKEVSASSCPMRVQLVRDLGILLARAVIVYHEEHVA